MEQASREMMSHHAFMFIFHHVFLPPNPPQSDDFDPEYEQVLLKTVHRALQNFRRTSETRHHVAVERAAAMVNSLRMSQDDSGAIGMENTLSALRDLSSQGGVLPLHIRAQNAGLIIDKVGNKYRFEAFELSPDNQSVISTKGRLRRNFPSCSVAIDRTVFDDNDFQSTLAQTIAKMSYQAVSEMQPKSRKGGKNHDENRDTTQPALVTQHLMSFLKATGEPIETAKISKNTREEVLWSSTSLPWRRSPLWLLIRVSLQIGFSRATDEDYMSSRDLYKTFMVFFLAHMLLVAHAHEQTLRGEILFAMNAKLSRRLMKLQHSRPSPWIDGVERAMNKTHSLITAKWRGIASLSEVQPDMSTLRKNTPSRDTLVAIPELDSLIVSITERTTVSCVNKFTASSELPVYPPESLPIELKYQRGDYKNFDLAALEAWVANHLPQWLESHLEAVETCDSISTLIRNYYDAGRSHYSQDPERSSVMLLTIIELWVAADRSACRIHGLLRDYDPGIPAKLLQCLVLPFKAEMERLHRVEQYLHDRKAHLNPKCPSIFEKFGDPMHFSVRYFDQSLQLQSLLQKIDSEASKDRQEKKTELRKKKSRFNELMRLHSGSACETYDYFDAYYHTTEKRHSPNCTKCAYLNEAQGMEIVIHEWPLPQNENEAKATVFELAIPEAFGAWRDVTAFLTVKILGCKYSLERPSHRYTPLNYEGLSPYSTHYRNPTRHVGVLSQVKPYTVDHRGRVKKVRLATETSLCLENALRYRYFDSLADSFLNPFTYETETVMDMCVYKFPRRSSSLDQYLKRTPDNFNGISPNNAIARQSDCPEHISLDEFKVLSILPYGYRLNWLNILAQLSAPSLDFMKVETSIVLLQMIYQCGPKGDNGDIRATHNVVTEEKFGQNLLAKLWEILQRVKENWESAPALATFTCLAARVLSITGSDVVRAKCLDFLRLARTVAFAWVELLRDRSQGSGETLRAQLLAGKIESALVCIGTFDVDPRHLITILSSPTDASIFIRCCMVLQECTSSPQEDCDGLLNIALMRRKFICFRAFPILSSRIVLQKDNCLNHAVRHTWSGYEPGSSWEALQSPHAHWLSCTTAARPGCDPLSVHFNLLTAELLVNGLPLSRLPANYEAHAMYKVLFGESTTVEVLPTTFPGMEFSAKRSYAGHIVYFGMQSKAIYSSIGPDLLVCAVKNGRKFDLLPSRLMKEKFPVALVTDYVHWYDHCENSIEFRPIADPWSASASNWHLRKVGPSWKLTRGSISLVGLTSKSAQAFSNIFSGLEESQHIHVHFSESSSLLSIELPRLQLDFFIRNGCFLIESRQYRGMSVDTDQSIGTLHGMRSKLVLKNMKSNRNQLLIVPEGQITYSKRLEHVTVSVDYGTATRCHAYHLDKHLGRLLDNGNLQSKLFLCYLHALTSYCLPDAFTQRTGREQALSILNSAAVRSFNALSEENVRLLTHISRLTPSRNYYPKHERVMQQIDWDSDLSFLSQDGSFYMSVRSIIDRAERGQMFHPDVDVKLPKLDFTTLDLLNRELIRSSTNYVAGYGTEHHTTKFDVDYSARDMGQSSDRAIGACIAATMVFQRRQALHVEPSSNLAISLWNYFQRLQSIQGPTGLLEPSVFNYDSVWLESTPPDQLCTLWCRIHLSLRSPTNLHNKFLIMMWLCTVAFAKNSDMQLVQTLAAFYNIKAMAHVNMPQVSRFDLSHGIRPNVSILEEKMRSCLVHFLKSPEASSPKQAYESESVARERRKREFRRNQDKTLENFAEQVASKWPQEAPQVPAGKSFSTYIRVYQALDAIRPIFKAWYQNHCFNEYLQALATSVRATPVHRIEEIPFPSHATFESPSAWSGHIRIEDLFSISITEKMPKAPAKFEYSCSVASRDIETSPRLHSLLEELEIRAKLDHEKEYIQMLRASAFSLREHRKQHVLNASTEEITDLLERYRSDWQSYVNDLYIFLQDSVKERLGTRQAITIGINHGPRLSPVFFMQQLSSKRWSVMASAWKACIIQYGLALTELQRAERLCAISENPTDLIEELLNVGHENWNPYDFPESLLLEVESGIMIRAVQEDIARQMRAPPLNENSVMQLNMGEGKSSVITQIVAAALADRTRLVRVVVAKPQSKQMLQMLVAKLGGMLDRQIYHMPFSRNLRLTSVQAESISIMCQECMDNGGILLVQPEHLLSFQLMGIECLFTDNKAVAEPLLSGQYFFDTKSRDIVDESDENFSVKFELIYTMGTQMPIQLSPERWTLSQKILRLVSRFASEVKRQLPCSIEVISRWSERFPRVRILRDDAAEMLLKMLANHICENGLPGLPISHQPSEVRRAILKYITKPSLSQKEIKIVENEADSGFWTDSTKNPLLLIRGLIAGGILSFCFSSKRWRVNFGLDSTRSPSTQLAVPYRAKDTPTPRSEFSHPDVVIILTSLSYYYGGLQDDDLFSAFQHLLRSDQAQIEYSEWVLTAQELPSEFHQLIGINLKDRSQCLQHVFPFLRYSKGAIDYFLSHLVFPKEMKEFPKKLSASGWDIGKIKTNPTTGFSGTNDSHHLLPLTVKHVDLGSQKHTNALVLEYLLQEVNTIVILPESGNSKESDADLLLSTVTEMNPPVRVILDVGAQILELSNVQVAKNWLSRISDKDGTRAVVFFNENDELSVIDRTGRIELHQTSPYAQQMDLCLIYLDESHTRGTDLRLPLDYRAAVTLGAKLTKDRLVQACMRMRKLGKGQSVAFCVPKEIVTKILEAAPRDNENLIEVKDVLNWCMLETCADLRQSMPLWAVQGQRYEHQNRIWHDSRGASGYNLSTDMAAKFLENEARSLEDRYSPHPTSCQQWLAQVTGNKNIQRIVERCQKFESVGLSSASLQEEQERELSPEVEQERQVERPSSAVPEKHHIHPDVKSFVATGHLKIEGAFIPAFESLKFSSAAKYLNLAQFPKELLATKDFWRTVKLTGSSDFYERSVQWILTHFDAQSRMQMIIISPFEAQELLPLVKKNRKVTLHLYLPRPNLQFKPLDDLNLFTQGAPFTPGTVPSRLITQLNLFSGQLYMSSYKEYTGVCDFLGLAWKAAEDGETVRADGFIVPRFWGEGFNHSPVKFLKVLISGIRRNCRSIEKTHVGRMLNTEQLEEADFD